MMEKISDYDLLREFIRRAGLTTLPEEVGNYRIVQIVSAIGTGTLVVHEFAFDKTGKQVTPPVVRIYNR